MINSKNGKVYGRLIYDNRMIASYTGKTREEVKRKLEVMRNTILHSR